MSFISISPKDVEFMMKELGISSINELFSDIPSDIRYRGNLNIPKMDESSVYTYIKRLLRLNKRIDPSKLFVGSGVYPVYVPAIVKHITERSEFLTSYTPYQPEISQGILQALFEYQSMICELLDMDVANCSMYGWASSLGEAARMAARVTRRNEFLVPHYMSHDRLAVLKSYAEPAGIRIIEINQNLRNGQIDIEDLKKKVSNRTAGVYIENPSYLGFLIESPEAIAEIVHDAGGLFIVGVDPISLGVLRPPGDYGADIAIGEGQPLGNYMNGGSLLGIFACKGEDRLIRQMPGRIIGMTTTLDGERQAFCMVLQTREQHIRRHRATSNICTNEALYALRAAVYMALLGPRGFREIGEIIISKTRLFMEKLSRIDGVRVPFFEAYHFKEFTINFDESSKSLQEVNRRLLEKGIIGGKELTSEFPELGQTSLYCVTEMHTSREIEFFCESLREVLEV